eukprot:2597349-Pyramimonas_sp.AAC.1
MERPPSASLRAPTAAAHSLPPQLEVAEREGDRAQPAALLRGEVGVGGRRCQGSPRHWHHRR